MKKFLVMVLVLFAVLVFASLALAEKQVFIGKVGVNSTGSEYEYITDKGIGYFCNIATYHRNYKDSYYNWDYTFLVGLRKHNSLKTNHMYYGLGLGVSGNIDPTVDANMGYEIHIPALPEFLFLRAEGGLSISLGLRSYTQLIDTTVHFGAGVGIDLNFFYDLFNR